MKCAVCRISENRRSFDVSIAEYNTVQAENMSELATVVVLDTASINGLHTVYEDRVARQALVDADALESLAMEQARRKAHKDNHLNWMS